MREVVVASFPIGKWGPTTQGGHLADEKRPGWTLCGFEIATKESTVKHVVCSLCFSRSGGTIAPHPWPAGNRDHSVVGSPEIPQRQEQP